MIKVYRTQNGRKAPNKEALSPMRPALAFVVMIALIGAIAPHVAAEPTLVIQVDHGQHLRVSNVTRVVVAAPEIADVNVINHNEMMVIAKKIGETTLNIWDVRGMTTYRVVVVAARVQEVEDALKEALNEPNVQVRTMGDAVVLEGSVKTDVSKARAESVASAFAKHVVNLLSVEQPAPAPAQVMETALRDALKDYPVVVRATTADTVIVEGLVTTQADLRRIDAITRAYVKNAVVLVRVREPMQIQIDTVVVEINRNALQNLGISYGGGTVQNGTIMVTDPYAFNFGYFNAANPFAPLQLLLFKLNLLQQKNAARVLANPRLTVREGSASKLLVGGEVPIPVSQTNGAVSITFKEFGIRLEFKALAEPGEPITLDMLTEVSSLDFTNAIVASGFTIPTIKSRRVQTVVNMRPGEFLSIGGLIQREDSQVIQKIPILGDIPILGALFRSTNFQHGETELVIFVSPQTVTPGKEEPKTPLYQPDKLVP